MKATVKFIMFVIISIVALFSVNAAYHIYGNGRFDGIVHGKSGVLCGMELSGNGNVFGVSDEFFVGRVERSINKAIYGDVDFEKVGDACEIKLKYNPMGSSKVILHIVEDDRNKFIITSPDDFMGDSRYYSIKLDNADAQELTRIIANLKKRDMKI